MRVAVTSQNRREVTEHAGRCRNFQVYEVQEGAIVRCDLLELAREQSFHDSPPEAPHPLDGVDVLITGGMGEGLRLRLARRGIAALVTTERDPECAVRSWLAGTLPTAPTHAHAHGHEHEHVHGAPGGCGCGGGCH